MPKWESTLHSAKKSFDYYIKNFADFTGAHLMQKVKGLLESLPSPNSVETIEDDGVKLKMATS